MMRQLFELSERDQTRISDALARTAAGPIDWDAAENVEASDNLPEEIYSPPATVREDPENPGHLIVERSSEAKSDHQINQEAMDQAIENTNRPKEPLSVGQIFEGVREEKELIRRNARNVLFCKLTRLLDDSEPDERYRMVRVLNSYYSLA